MLHNNYLCIRMRMAKGCVVGVRLMELNIEESMKNVHCTSRMAWQSYLI